MRMFVQATEEGNPENVQILGLQLDNYFPSTAGLKQGWGDSLLNEGKLIHFVLQHITVPLTAAAVDAQTEAGATPGSFLSAFSFEQLGWPAQASSVYTSRAAMAGIAAAVAVAGIAGVLVLSRGSRLPR